ncbi:MAG: hypothetical protein V1717_02035, partial [Candidatus Micrarchaeota archaeon]
MFLGLLFLASSLYAGFAAAKRLAVLDSLAKKLSLGFLLGFAVQTFFILAISWLFGALSSELVMASSLLFFLAGFKLQPQHPARYSKSVSKSELLALAFALLFLALHLFAALRPTETGVEGVISVWGDYPLHLGIASSFAFGSNFPPEYPILAGEPLKYSFAMDFASAILLKGGFGLRSSLVIPNVLVFLALAMAVVLLTELVGGRKKAFALTAMVLLLFFLNGNAGIGFAFQDALQEKSLSPLTVPEKNYSNLEDKNIVLMNFLYSIFLPSRSALLGFAIAVFLYALLFSNVLERKWRKEELFAGGVLAGLLPLAHAQSFLAVGVVAGCLFLLCEKKKEWLYFAVPAALVALPQVAWLWGRFPFSKQVGWVAAEKTLGGIVVFWLENGWALLLGFFAWAAIAWVKKDRKMLVFSIPFFLLFIMGNVALFQPWAWDNTKIFLHFFLFASIATALFLSGLLESKKFGAASKAIVAAIFFLSIASGILALFWVSWGDNARYEVFSKKDFVLAEWVRKNTP